MLNIIVSSNDIIHNNNNNIIQYKSVSYAVIAVEKI